ncbi:MAG: LAGLIDADG family homing endonuclease [Patescibacteria group bacterium]
MTERIKYGKRAVFAKGAQTSFICSLEKSLSLGLGDLSKIAGVSRRTIYDWKREKFSMSLSALKKLCSKTNIPVPSSVQVRGPFWYASKGGKIGGSVVMGKYGRVPVHTQYRIARWRTWWEREGKFAHNKIFVPLPCKNPPLSNELAEFLGIMMGDGGMSKYQVSVTLHHVDDKEYGHYITRLMKKLFGVTPTTRHIPKISVNTYTISRVRLVHYLRERGLVIGNKIRQQIGIPDWIMKKRRYRIACLRGLVDTDGSVVVHRYLSSGKYYTYKKIDFSSRSALLLGSVNVILCGLGIRSGVRKRNIRIEAQKDVKRYFAIVGSHNPKHRERYQHGEVA